MSKLIRRICELKCTSFTEEEYNDFTSQLIKTIDATNIRLGKNIKVYPEFTNENLITVKTNSGAVWLVVKDRYINKSDYVLLHEISNKGYHIQSRRDYFQYIVNSFVSHEYRNKKSYAYNKMNYMIQLIDSANASNKQNKSAKGKKFKNEGKMIVYV